MHDRSLCKSVFTYFVWQTLKGKPINLIGSQASSLGGEATETRVLHIHAPMQDKHKSNDEF
jgi:hypothetical protein